MPRVAKMDQLSRSVELTAALERTDWDLVLVDEAHRMSAHYVGQERKLTKRYQLGLLLGRIARHLLLMTATPHAGKEEDFQLFMALLAGTGSRAAFATAPTSPTSPTSCVAWSKRTC